MRTDADDPLLSGSSTARFCHNGGNDSVEGRIIACPVARPIAYGERAKAAPRDG